MGQKVIVKIQVCSELGSRPGPAKDAIEALLSTLTSALRQELQGFEEHHTHGPTFIGIKVELEMTCEYSCPISARLVLHMERTSEQA